MNDTSWIRGHVCGVQQFADTAGQTASAKQRAPGETGAADAELEKVSREFESLLLGFMLKEMRATIPESGLFPASMTEDIFTDMLDQQLSAKISQNGGLGISRIVFDKTSLISLPRQLAAIY